MSAPQHPAPQGGPGNRHPDPLAMTPGEKLAAEWEARHDVAARGHRADPGAVQHYLAESRTREAPRSGSTASADAVPAPAHGTPAPRPTGGTGASPPPAPAPRPRWGLFRRRSR